MPFLFCRPETFITPLNSTEVQHAVAQVLETQTKTLFFNATTYYGKIDATEFRVSSGNSKLLDFGNPKVKGIIQSENPTKITLYYGLPVVVLCFFLIFPLTFVPAAFLSEQMVINGVDREPEFWERLLFAVMGTVVPGIIFFFNVIVPLMNTRSSLKRALKIKAIQKDSNI